MRASSTGSYGMWSPSCRSGCAGHEPHRPAQPDLLQPQVLNQRVRLFGRDVHHVHVVPQARGRAVTGTDALGELQRDRAVIGGVATLHAELRLAVLDQLVSPAQHTRQPATDPQPRLPELFPLALEELVKG